jgi:hypothetical protein
MSKIHNAQPTLLPIPLPLPTQSLNLTPDPGLRVYSVARRIDTYADRSQLRSIETTPMLALWIVELHSELIDGLHLVFIIRADLTAYGE